jgi:hypothetical protein
MEPRDEWAEPSGSSAAAAGSVAPGLEVSNSNKRSQGLARDRRPLSLKKKHTHTLREISFCTSSLGIKHRHGGARLSLERFSLRYFLNTMN